MSAADWCFAVMSFLAAWAAIAYIIEHRQNRDLRHLCNAYRAELGEPPLFPTIACRICNPVERSCPWCFSRAVSGLTSPCPHCKDTGIYLPTLPHPTRPNPGRPSEKG